MKDEHATALALTILFVPLVAALVLTQQPFDWNAIAAFAAAWAVVVAVGLFIIRSRVDSQQRRHNRLIEGFGVALLCRATIKVLLARNLRSNYTTAINWTRSFVDARDTQERKVPDFQQLRITPPAMLVDNAARFHLLGEDLALIVFEILYSIDDWNRSMDAATKYAQWLLDNNVTDVTENTHLGDRIDDVPFQMLTQAMNQFLELETEGEWYELPLSERQRTSALLR